MTWTAETSDGNESAKIRWEIVQYTRGRGLDLGCGPNKAFPHFIGVDNGHHEQFGYQIKPDIMVKTCEKLDVFASQSMDFVFSSHLLEHIQDYKGALKEWWRLIKPGGYLVLYLPHKDFYPNIGHDHANPDHKHDFVPQDIINAMQDMKAWDLVENQDRNGGNEYSFLQIYKRIGGEKNRHSWNQPKPEKSAAVVRYGAFGDLMQASSVLAGLKRQGYHVTLYSSPPGSDVVMYDPNIDQLVLQDKDQVPNGNLGEFWDYLKKKYDKFVNLSESVEGTWLAIPGRANHAWPKNLRHKLMNKNYVEFQHELAGVPHEPRIKFYATEEEKDWAKKFREKMRASFVVLWSMSGSSKHKTWPHMDRSIASFMVAHPSIHVVLVGGPETEMLQAGWENEQRVHRMAGKWTIRQTLAFLDQADLVIGPETGVLNAASCLPVPKIVFLSHSSVENLTRDWVNTTSLYADDVHCYPCHQLHYNWDHCNRDMSVDGQGTALCQSKIVGEKFWAACEAPLRNHFEKVA